MNIAKSRLHLSERVSRYIDVVCSLSGEPLRNTLSDIFGSRSRKMIVGGLVRDLARGGIASRHFDVDVVLDLDPEEVCEIGRNQRATENRFGGFSTVRGGWKIDFWALSTTWARKAGYASIHHPIDIIDTTFFNVDAVAFDVDSCDVFMAQSYLNELRQGVLELNLEPNPSVDGNAVRAVRRLKMWKYSCGPRLSKFLYRHVDDAMFRHIVETERRIYGKSYAGQYRSHIELLQDIASGSDYEARQLELDFHLIGEVGSVEIVNDHVAG